MKLISQAERRFDSSLNAIHFNTMIYSDDLLRAQSKMNELISLLPEKMNFKRTEDYAKTTIGTFRARKYSENCRGYRYQNVYIDKSLLREPEIINLIIMKLRPPGYYGEIQDESYNWEDHVYYF